MRRNSIYTLFFLFSFPLFAGQGNQSTTTANLLANSALDLIGKEASPVDLRVADLLLNGHMDDGQEVEMDASLPANAGLSAGALKTLQEKGVDAKEFQKLVSQ